ncbi:MAG: acyltransferase [Alphaproteobacteria bacterium]
MSQAFPADLKALTSLRFWAALWVLVFHYRPYLGVEAVSWGVLQKGYLAVDFFFMLSGFILAHVYRGQLQAGAYSHGGFVLKRLARIYPMHITTLAAFVAIGLLALAAGLHVEDPARYDWRQLPQTILLVHAWIGSGEAFNFPSWSISAEFFAYICFPLVMMLARWPRLMLAAGVVAVFGWYVAAIPVAGAASTHLDDWKLMRIMPEFLLGAGLREVMDGARVPVLRLKHATLASLAIVLALAVAGAPDWVMLIALVALLVAGAERARSGVVGVLEHKVSVYLGDVSYALYMVHILVAMTFFEIVDRVIPRATHVSIVSIGIVIVAVIVAVVTAMISDRVIERPGRRLIVNLGKLRLGSRPKPG